MYLTADAFRSKMLSLSPDGSGCDRPPRLFQARRDSSAARIPFSAVEAQINIFCLVLVTKITFQRKTRHRATIIHNGCDPEHVSRRNITPLEQELSRDQACLEFG